MAALGMPLVEMKRRRADCGRDSKSSVTEGSTFNVTDLIGQELVRKKKKPLWVFQA